MLWLVNIAQSAFPFIPAMHDCNDVKHEVSFDLRAEEIAGAAHQASGQAGRKRKGNAVRDGDNVGKTGSTWSAKRAISALEEIPDVISYGGGTGLRSMANNESLTRDLPFI
jgi:hypothetical protein